VARRPHGVEQPHLQFDNILFMLEPTEFALGLRRKRITIADYDPDGRLELS
jgi:hypothetical protein